MVTKPRVNHWMLAVAVSAVLVVLVMAAPSASAEPIRVGTFDVDVTPPIGSPLAYDPMEEKVMPLRAKGIVLIGGGEPIVLCAVDWIGIGNDGQTAWKEALAEAADTHPRRVAVHSLHQHDAPSCDFSAERVLAEQGISGSMFNVEFARQAIDRTADAVAEAIEEAREATHVGLGTGRVEKVASNRRILGPDGKVAAMRWTACRDPELRAEPAGIIDPNVRLLSFWNDDQPLAVLTYYATHPQSYYRTGGANPDFPGIARQAREEEVGATHVHFAGAGGNIGAGKWNDGSHENRQILADRLAEGMKAAWEATEKQPIDASDLDWVVEPVALPVADHLDAAALEQTVNDSGAALSQRTAAAKALAWVRRRQQGETIDIACLRIGNARILYMPGELVVEYQLAVQAMAPDNFVAMAAYGDYAMGYICMTHHYWQGGYEASDRASRVAPSVQPVLMGAMRNLLQPQ